jgi:hypothetical protein
VKRSKAELARSLKAAEAAALLVQGAVFRASVELALVFLQNDRTIIRTNCLLAVAREASGDEEIVGMMRP